MLRSILFYSIIFYSILFYSIKFYSILFVYSIQFNFILFYSILFNSILFYSILLAPPEPPKALPKLLQTLPQALPGPPRAMPRFGGVQGEVRARFDRKNSWFSHNFELVMDAAGATGAVEVVARPAARTPHPTRAGGQDDGSYTNSLKPSGPA